MLRRVILSAVAAGLAIPARAEDGSLPLFFIERSINANVIHYEAKVGKDSRLDPRQPVIAYWIMAAEDGRRQELNLLERTRAYGFAVRPDGSNDSYTMTLASDRRRPIHVYLRDGGARAETTIGGHRALLQKIFVTTRKVLTLNEPVSAELYGVDVATGEPCYEKVTADR
jgi:hypothetical protein